MHHYIYLWKWYFSGHSRVWNSIAPTFPVRQDLSLNMSSVLLCKLSPKQNTKIWNVINQSLPTWESTSPHFTLSWWECLPAVEARRQPSDKRATCWRLIYQCWQLPDSMVTICGAAQAALPAASGRIWMLCPSRSPPQPQLPSPAVRRPGHCWHASGYVPHAASQPQRTIGVVTWVYTIYSTAQGWRVWLKTLLCPKLSNLDALVPLV